MDMTPEEIAELQEELRVGNILTAKLTDQCRELEAQLSKVHSNKCPRCKGKRTIGTRDFLNVPVVIDCPTCKGTGIKPHRDRPKIICLCGSTRFVDTFNEWRQKLTLEGKIVVSIELVLPQSEREDPQHSNYKVKQMLDELHLRKIDLADEVIILNVGGYIGESTRNELNYAIKMGKEITYLEEES